MDVIGLTPARRLGEANNVPRGAEAAPPTLEQSLRSWVDAAPPEHQQVRMDVQNRMLDWRRENPHAAHAMTPLDLSGMQLSELPPAIGMLDGLRTLYLNNNALTELPHEIGQLRHLEHLDVTANRIGNLPAEIFGLTDLTSLRADDNPLGALPASVGQLTNLNELGFSNCQLSELPDEIGNLDNLRTLDLHGNQITQVPSGIQMLSDLRHVNLGGNPLQELPPALLQLAERCQVTISPEGAPPEFMAHLETIQTQRRVAAHAAHSAGQLRMAQARANAPGQYDEDRIAFLLPHDQRQTLSADEHGPIEKAESFFEWLDRMPTTVDYQDAAARPQLESQLGHLVDEMRSDIGLRKQCFAIAFEALASCDDRVSLALNEMHEAMLVAKSLRPSVGWTDMLGLGTRLYALKLVNTFAHQKIAALEQAASVRGEVWEEGIETMLHVQTALSAYLRQFGIDVPVQIQQMRYGFLSGVSDNEILAAGEQIRDAFAQGDEMEGFLRDWAPLRTFVTTANAPVYDALDEAAQLRMEALTEQVEKGSINQGAYVTTSNSVMTGLDARKTWVTNSLIGVQRQTARLLDPKSMKVDVTLPPPVRFRAVGQHLLGQGRLDQAENMARMSIKADPLQSQSHLLLVKVLLERGRPAEALAAAKALQALEPSNPWAAHLIVRSHLLMGDALLAHETLQATRPALPFFTALHTAMVEHSLGHAENAKQAMAQALDELAQRGLPLSAEVAIAYGWMGDATQAAQWLVRSSEVDNGQGLVHALISPMSAPLEAADPLWVAMRRIVTDQLAS